MTESKCKEQYCCLHNKYLINVRSNTWDDQKSGLPKSTSKLLNHSNQHWQCFLYDIKKVKQKL